jgi:hypothetical protein
MIVSAYSFLDPHKEHAFLAVYIVGIFVVACVIFAAVQLLCMFRERLVTPRGDQKPAHPEAINDWQTIEKPDSPSAV